MKLNGRRGVQDEKRLILEHKLLAQPSYSFLSVDSCSLYGHYWKCELIQFWIKNSDWNPIHCLRSSILDLFSHLVINPVSNLSQRHRLLKRQASLLSRISSGRRPFKRSLPLLLFSPQLCFTPLISFKNIHSVLTPFTVVQMTLSDCQANCSNYLMSLKQCTLWHIFAFW